MKPFKSLFFAVGLVVALFCTIEASAQFMPVVYDNIYGDRNNFTVATADFRSGDMVMGGVSDGLVIVTWLDREGNSRFTKKFEEAEFVTVNKIIPMGEDKVLVVGRRKVSDREKIKQGGRAVVLGINGNVERTLSVGDDSTEIYNAQFVANDNLILTGTTPSPQGGFTAFVCKVSPQNKIIYNYTAAVGELCTEINILGSRTEIVNAAFTSVEKAGSSVVRLDENGKPYFITPLPDPTFKIQKMVSTVDGDVYLVGHGSQAGGAVIKIRPEGDIVFQKQIVPVSAGTTLDKLIVCPTGELMVGGNDDQNAYFALLRSDGTQLYSNVDRGVVSGIANDPHTGDCIISFYDKGRQGRIIKISNQGRRLYERLAAGNYTALCVNFNGDLLMAAPETGRLTMVSGLGEILFDRFVVENSPQQFTDVLTPVSGEVVFLGANGRVAKLAHGLYIGDILVNKPIDGYATATFTVTLSGYSYSSEGAPIPVTVNYRSAPITAKEGVNFDAVSGTLSFVPSTDASDRYLNKFVVEVPIRANDLLEGMKTFSLGLSDVKNSYLIRSSGVASIEDQPAVVRMISTTPSVEGQTDITYTLGIFKTNGTPLTNSTNADIVIDGVYGKGTADHLDFDMGRLPRLVVAPGQSNGTFNVVTLDDTRYESVKSVVVDFNKIYSMSDTYVSFGGNLLSCAGQLFDQPAYVTIESLGDYTKLNNTISGFFKLVLVRAKDGVSLTNNSGGDIALTVEINDGSSAKYGTDFVLTNAHDLRIWGDGRSGAVNLNGMALYTPENDEKTVSVTLKDVKADEGAGEISVSPDRYVALITIKNK